VRERGRLTARRRSERLITAGQLRHRQVVVTQTDAQPVDAESAAVARAVDQIRLRVLQTGAVKTPSWGNHRGHWLPSRARERADRALQARSSVGIRAASCTAHPGVQAGFIVGRHTGIRGARFQLAGRLPRAAGDRESEGRESRESEHDRHWQRRRWRASAPGLTARTLWPGPTRCQPSEHARAGGV
jgi:hypothetical protein